MQHNKPLNKIFVQILVYFLLIIQIFPPLWVQDVTSLRHFFIGLFDISAFTIITIEFYKHKYKLFNPLKFKPILIFLLLIVWMAISIIWAINKIEGIAVLNRWFLIFFTSILIGNILNNHSNLFSIIIYGTMIITLINVLTCLIGYYYFDLHISQRNNLMLNGGYGNKNIFAVCLLFKLPFLYYVIIRYKKIWKIISSILIILVCFCLVIISTRSTFIGLFLQLIILVSYTILQKIRFNINNIHIIYIGMIIGCAVIGLLSGNKFIEYNFNKYAKKDITNNYTIAARVHSIEEGNSKGRLLIWKNTIEIIKMKPLLGYGIGNHKLNIMRVEAKKKMNYIVSDHAHNDFLEMQSELGIIGELLYLLLYISMFVTSWKLIYNKHTKQIHKSIALISLLILVTYMNDAIFNFPNERATPQLYLALSIGLLMFVYKKSNKELKKSRATKIILIFTSIIIISCFYIESCHFVSSIVQRQRIICSNNHNKKHIPPSFWVNISPWLPNIDESTKPIAINNAKMFAIEGDYKTAINLILTDNSNPFYGLKEYRLASYYSHLNMTDSSDYWADRCIEMKPLCYDPVSVKVGNRKKENNISKQIELIENYLIKEKKEERAWISLINLYINQNNFNKANEICNKSLEYNPENKQILAKKREIDIMQQEKL